MPARVVTVGHRSTLDAGSLLADVFENFHDFALANYGLDPIHYITLPSFSCDALLKFTGAKLELLDDPDMYHLSVVVLAQSPTGTLRPTTHAFRRPLTRMNQRPTSCTSMPTTSMAGLEVDLEYPPELHETHTDYPIAPEPLVLLYLSKYSAELQDKRDISDVEYTKLIPNLMDKQHYIILHRTLQQCLDLGLKLK